MSANGHVPTHTNSFYGCTTVDVDACILLGPAYRPHIWTAQDAPDDCEVAIGGESRAQARRLRKGTERPDRESGLPGPRRRGPASMKMSEYGFGSWHQDTVDLPGVGRS